MSTPVLNNALFYEDKFVKATSHLDSLHLRNMIGDVKPTDMGVVDLWAMMQKTSMPLYQMAKFGGKNIVTVDDPRGEWSWKTPLANDLPYIVANIEDDQSTTLGKMGTTFKIKLNERAFGHGDIITYDKMNGAELYITEEDILPQGDGYVYTVTLPEGGAADHLDPKFLAPGTKYFRVGSVRGEYGERFSDISVKTGYREYFNFVGNGKAQVHYTITDTADAMLKGALRADGTVPVMQIWRCRDNEILDPSVKTFNDLKNKLGKEGFAAAVQEGRLSTTYLTQLEAAHMNKITADIENQLMWGKGGVIKTDGADDVRLSVGLWKQLDNGYKRMYNKASFSLDMFESEIYNFYNGRVDLTNPDPTINVVVQTGRAGYKLASDAIMKKALNSTINSGLAVNADKSGLGVIKGTPMNLSYGMSFGAITFPLLANVSFVINPALDPIEANDVENPMIDGYRLSSYSFIVNDITDDNQDNIYLLKKKWDGEFRWWYQNGTGDYNGKNAGFASTGRFAGYSVFMEQAYPAIWVKDPTKILKIVMKNPITGGTL